MIFAEYLLAAAMLAGNTPADLENAAALEAAFPVLREPLTSLCIQLEILDPKERNMLVRAGEFKDDLKQLQDRYRDLHDVPFVADSVRFPDRSDVNELLLLNRGYLKHLEMRQAMELAPTADLHALRGEVEDLYRVWDAVRDSRCEYYYVWVRRYAMKRLRDMVGDEAYYRSELPPFVPFWRYQVMQ